MSLEKMERAIRLQPRSGVRMQPTAQAVGAWVGDMQAPKGRKKSYDTDSVRDGTPRSSPLIWILLALLFAPLAAASDCIPIHEASHHIGEVQCVTGKVLHVRPGTGVHYINFCEDEAACPFTVVVFPRDLKDVGDIRRLEGRVIEINGAVKMYDGRAEIILNRISQLHGGAAMIRPLPKNYDVEKRGHYSPGRLHPTKKPKKTKAKPQTTATYGNDVEGQNPE